MISGDLLSGSNLKPFTFFPGFGFCLSLILAKTVSEEGATNAVVVRVFKKFLLEFPMYVMVLFFRLIIKDI
jgi:hypothetical protein